MQEGFKKMTKPLTIDDIADRLMELHGKLGNFGLYFENYTNTMGEYLDKEYRHTVCEWICPKGKTSFDNGIIEYHVYDYDEAEEVIIQLPLPRG